MADTVIMPKLGFDMAEGTLVRWVVKEGESIAKGAVLAEIETDKATVEVESNFEGTVLRHLVSQGDIVPVNTPIAIIGQPGEKVELPESAPKAASVPPIGDQTETGAAKAVEAEPAMAVDSSLPDGVRASPLARRIASEKDIDLGALTGTGPGGRIVKADVEAFTQTEKPLPVQAPAQTQTSSQALPSLPTFAAVGEVPPDAVVPLNRLRAAIGRRMVEVKGAVPHFYITHEYDVAKVMQLRKQVNALLPDDQKVSVNDFVIKAVALALRQYPNLNATLRQEGIVRFGAVNVGVAVAVEGGLLTVVCKNADMKPLRQIAVEIRAMAGRVRQGKVRPDDIEGSTFSVSNLGMFDVESFIAIINPPEAAILAVGSAKEVPVITDGELAKGWRMKATISVDHRISDGAEAAQFMQVLARYLEEPLALLL